MINRYAKDADLIDDIFYQLSLASMSFPGKSIIEMIYDISDIVEPGRTANLDGKRVAYKLTNRKIYEILVKYNEMREADRKNYESQNRKV